MDLEEIRKRRDELAEEITAAVQKFQAESGAVVSRVDLEQLFTDESTMPFRVLAHVKIDLT